MLAGKIPDSLTSKEKNGDSNSMFLAAVEESEIIEVVHECKVCVISG